MALPMALKKKKPVICLRHLIYCLLAMRFFARACADNSNPLVLSLLRAQDYLYLPLPLTSWALSTATRCNARSASWATINCEISKSRLPPYRPITTSHPPPRPHSIIFSNDSSTSDSGFSFSQPTPAVMMARRIRTLSTQSFTKSPGTPCTAANDGAIHTKASRKLSLVAQCLKTRLFAELEPTTLHSRYFAESEMAEFVSHKPFRDFIEANGSRSYVDAWNAFDMTGLPDDFMSVPVDDTPNTHVPLRLNPARNPAWSSLIGKNHDITKHWLATNIRLASVWRGPGARA
ncbi:uncharacterized protein K452DRAFT_312029 [Aplosporella prunicola CBS 121167]|uniref:Uncharacterized protein n=1 Tax=Aplosporella prunicola CBS 121167 TaxID=1176127 RepID=A0A6A6B3E7_9PEZI|nr:uncharacterized protein K452DRAFT_312029 [Aplosporella prunicola CBS 121167]KAF2137893.1 hypothetical protein K452DRAFT_312029 [Aplosporella prunicola CBS 121167]